MPTDTQLSNRNPFQRPFHNLLRAAVRHFSVVVIVIVIALMASFGDGLQFAIYDRELVNSGEWWRIYTAQFAHLNLNHLLLNLVAWVLIYIYGWFECDNKQWVWLIASTTVLCGTTIHLVETHVMWHVGLSGILHGLFLSVTLFKLQKMLTDVVGWIGLVALAGKLYWEWHYGAIGNTQELIGTPVLTEAHAHGAWAGLVATLISFGWTWLRGRIAQEH